MNQAEKKSGADASRPALVEVLGSALLVVVDDFLEGDWADAVGWTRLQRRQGFRETETMDVAGRSAGVLVKASAIADGRPAKTAKADSDHMALGTGFVLAAVKAKSYLFAGFRSDLHGVFHSARKATLGLRALLVNIAQRSIGERGMNMKRKVILLALLFCAAVAVAQQPINLTNAAGTALGAPSNYGTSPGAVEVIGVNAFVTNTVTVAGSGVFEVGPTTSANTTANPFFHNLSDGTNSLTANAITTWGTAPTGKVLGVNANILSPIDGSGYVEVDCKTGCTATTTISLVPQTSGGLSVSHFVAAASNNATNVKASAGQVYQIDAYNNAAYPVYFKLYNSASSPSSCGASNLFKVVGIQSGTQHTLQTEEGWAMGTGIGYCLTKGIADADNTAVLASDATVDLSWK